MPELRVTIPQIAAACGVKERTVHDWIKRPEWPAGERSGLGGALMFNPETLPVAITLKGKPFAVRAPVKNWALHQAYAAPQAISVALLAPASKPAKPLALVPVSLATPDSEQLDIERARERIFEFIKAFAGSVPRAIEHLNAHHYAGTLPGPLVWAYDHAWDKPRAKKHLNLSTLNKWKSIKKKRGRSAPLKLLPDMSVKPWHALAVALVKRPQGSLKKWIHEQIVEHWDPVWGGEPPSYDVVCTFFRDKFSKLDQIEGRYTGSQLRSHKFYQHRTSDGLAPWDEIHADGWNTHFYAPHPYTKEYVTLEVWHAHDVATRYVPPFGVGLSENFEVIAKCIENAYRDGGPMLFLQSDSTRAIKNSERLKTNPATALADRAGFVIVHPEEVGNSQANGIAENFNTWLDRESRELATYQNPRQMDELSFKRVKKITADLVKAQKTGDLAQMQAKKREAERMGKGLVLMSYEQTLAWLESKRQKWNNKPHRSLPKVRDPQTGVKRHQTPNEALAAARAAGWQPAFPDLPREALEDHLIDLFRPHVQVKVTRGTVSPYGGMRYRDEALDHYLGQEVVVAYDIMDWRVVWVKTLKGELICAAPFVEATGYRTKTAQQHAEEKRTQARIRHKQKAIGMEREKARLANTIDQEKTIVLAGGALDLNAVAAPIKPAQMAEAAMPGGDTHPLRTSDAGSLNREPQPRSRRDMTPLEIMTEWHGINTRMLKGQAITEAEAEWHEVFKRHPIYKAAYKDTPFRVATRHEGSDPPNERRASA